MNVVLKLGDKELIRSNEGKQSRKYETRLERSYNAIKANAYSNNIKVTTSYRERDEEAVTRMNELPEWDDVEREAEVVDDEVKEVNTLDYKYYADIEDICIATVDYIKNTILKNEDVHVSITLDIADEDNSNDLLTKIFTDDDIPENYGESDDDIDVSEKSDSDELQYNGEIIKEIVEQNKDIIETILDKDQEESEDTNVDYDEPEDAYEDELEDSDKVEEYSSSFIDHESLPVGSTQVNESCYNHDEKEK